MLGKMLINFSQGNTLPERKTEKGRQETGIGKELTAINIIATFAFDRNCFHSLPVCVFAFIIMSFP